MEKQRMERMCTVCDTNSLITHHSSPTGSGSLIRGSDIVKAIVLLGAYLSSDRFALPPSFQILVLYSS